MKNLLNSLRELTRYPSAIAGLLVILALVVLAVYAMIAIPYPEAIRLWQGGSGVWDEYPRLAPPAWFNWFSAKKVPETIILKSTAGGVDRKVEERSATTKIITMTYSFNYQYDDFPKELTVFFNPIYPTSNLTPSLSFASLTWVTPDGRRLEIGTMNLQPALVYRFARDDVLVRKLKRFVPQGVVLRPKEVETGLLPEKVLFLDPNRQDPTPLKGTYSLIMRGTTFEPGADVEADFVVYGQLYGLAGTDHYRRDLVIPLLWGAPLALAFGLLAALGTTVLEMIIAAISTWFGGITDQVIQRVTEVNMVLPFLSILIMVGTFYSRSIWVMLGLVILLSIFGAGIKTYRAIFLQVKEATYIEAARSYGASNMRIVFLYMIPRIIPMLIPGLVTLIPGYVFLEAALAFLGLGDPTLPTWGKVINDANQMGALYNGQYYWVLEPAALLMLTGLGFAMVGFALDRVFNPRLRGM
jgi:peptide/nickel transport system permease protein